MKIMIVEDDAIVRMSLKTILSAKGHQIVAELDDGNGAVSLYQEKQPDVVLMDIRMPNKDGLQTSRELLQKDAHACILLLTTFNDEEYIIKALKLGVSGYILKQNYESLEASLQAAREGQKVYNTEIVEKIGQLLKKKPTAINQDLTGREVEIIELVAQGYNNKEISQTLYLSEGTVRNYISSLLNKLALRDRTQLAIYYYQYMEEAS